MQKPASKRPHPPHDGKIVSNALYQEVAGRLRHRILSHELGPGTWIDEQALAQAYGISRTPLREALKVLAGEGLVTLKPRRGCYVVKISQRDVEEIFPVLALLEGRCAYEAAERIRPDQLQRLEALHQQLERRTAQKDREACFEINQEFHRTLNELAGNRWMLQIINDLRKVMKLVRYHSLLLEGRLEESLAEHRRIMAAIRKHDPAAAEECMRAHLLSGRDAMTKLQSPKAAAESRR
ncbi:MAG: GntR family transcriptional regulator [Terriglobales bacterium]